MRFLCIEVLSSAWILKVNCNSEIILGKIDPRAFGLSGFRASVSWNLSWSHIVTRLIIESNAVVCIFDFYIDTGSFCEAYFYLVGYKLIYLAKILQFDNRASGFFIFADIGKFSITAILDQKADQISCDIEIRRINN